LTPDQANTDYKVAAQSGQSNCRTVSRVESSVTESRDQHSFLSRVFVVVATTVAEFFAELRPSGGGRGQLIHGERDYQAPIIRSIL
jgi:hypothetical protein